MTTAARSHFPKISQSEASLDQVQSCNQIKSRLMSFRIWSLAILIWSLHASVFEGKAQGQISGNPIQILEDFLLEFENISTFQADVLEVQRLKGVKGRPDKRTHRMRIFLKDIQTDFPSALIRDLDTDKIVLKVFQGIQKETENSLPQELLDLRSVNLGQLIPPIILGSLTRIPDGMTVEAVASNRVQARAPNDVVIYEFRLDLEQNVVRSFERIAGAGSGSTKYIFNDYTIISGILFPLSIKGKREVGGFRVNTQYSYLNVKINIDIPDDIFE